jgi:hypothetical protein
MKTSEYRLMRRDVDIAKVILPCEVALRRQIEFLLFPPGSSACVKRMMVLAQKKVLHVLRQPDFHTEGRQDYVYTVCDKTIETIAEWDNVFVEDIEWSGHELTKWNMFIPHALDVSWVYFSFLKSARNHDFTFTWRSTLLLEKLKLFESVEIPGLRGQTKKKEIQPDALMMINNRVRDFYFYIEVERTREKQYEILEKMTVYLYLLTQPGRKGRVVFVLLTQEKLLRYKAFCESIGGRNHFWFVLLDSLLTHDPLTDSIFMKSGSEGTYSIF